MTPVTAAMGIGFVLMWSSAFTSARIAVQDAPPFLLLSVRFAISGLLALAIARALGQRITLGRAEWRAVALFGLCQNTLYLGLNFVAMQRIEASVAVIVASALPLTVAAVRRLRGERMGRLAITGLLAGSVGVLVVMSGRLSGGADPVGVALSVAGLVALTAATLLVAGASARGNLLTVVGLQMLVGAVSLFALSLALEEWVINWTWRLAAAFTYTTLIPGLAATLVWFVLVGRVGATRAASFHFLNPFFGVAIAALVLGEVMGPRDLLGVAVITAGIWCVQRAGMRSYS